MTAATLCWHCSTQMDFTTPACPRCSAINANVDPDGALAQCHTAGRLMAAAPDLLDALKMGVAETLDYIRINNLAGAEKNHWIVLAQAAIAKAEAA